MDIIVAATREIVGILETSMIIFKAHFETNLLWLSKTEWWSLSSFFIIIIKKICFKDNSTTTVDTDVILPGTEYEIKLKAIYIDEVISEPETIFITTGKRNILLKSKPCVNV